MPIDIYFGSHSIKKLINFICRKKIIHNFALVEYANCCIRHF